MMFLSNVFLSASIHNYPGAEALDRLLTQHINLRLLADEDELQHMNKPLFVHIDTLAATTGVTR